MEEDSSSSSDEDLDIENEEDWWMQDSSGNSNSKKSKKKRKKKNKKKVKKSSDSGDREETKEEDKEVEEDEDEEEDDEYSSEEERFGGWLLEMILSMLQPGVSAQTLKLLNYVFFALFGCLMIMIIVGGRARIHAFILLFLSSGLFFSLQWYLSARSITAEPGDASDQKGEETKQDDKKTN